MIATNSNLQIIPSAMTTWEKFIQVEPAILLKMGITLAGFGLMAGAVWALRQMAIAVRRRWDMQRDSWTA